MGTATSPAASGRVTDTAGRASRPSSKAARRLPRGPALWGLIFIAPAMLVFLVFVVAPVVWTTLMSFAAYEITGSPEFLGLENYANLLADREFGTAMLNTLVYVVGTVPPHIALGLALALLLNMKLRGLAFFRSAFYVPGVTSAVAASLMWIFVYNPQIGPANLLLRALGFPGQQWLLDVRLALACIVVMSIWQGIGSGMLIYLAGLQGIPAMFYEAAAIDGAGGWQRFWHITWPLLRPTTLFVLVTSCIGAFQVFQQPYVMTRGGPMDATLTVVLNIYMYGFRYGRMGYASAMAVLLFALIMLISVLNLRFFSKEVQY